MAPASPEAPSVHEDQPASEQSPGVAAPRMSNAFARKHGLNPKDNPLVNLQKMALAGHIGQTHHSAPGKVNPVTQMLPILPSETAAPMMKGANRQQKLLKQTSQATLEALALSMNNMSLSPSNSTGSPKEEQLTSNPSSGSVSACAIYQEKTPVHGDVVSISQPPITPGSPAAVSHVQNGQYIAKGPHSYVVGSPVAQDEYVQMAAAGHTGVTLAMVGQPGPISLHQGQ